MERDHDVKVLELSRLRSELAIYIWAQSVVRRGQRIQAGGGEPGDRSAYMHSKATLIQETGQYAGLELSFSELVSCLQALLDQAKDEEIHSLDPQHIALKISAKA